MGSQKGKPHRNEVTSLLDCQHSSVFYPPPSLGDEVYCTRCGDYSYVIAVHGVWKSRCNNCTYARAYGADVFGAKTGIAKHLLREPEHTVTLFHGPLEIQTYSNEQDPLCERMQERLNLYEKAKGAILPTPRQRRASYGLFGTYRGNLKRRNPGLPDAPGY